VLDTAEIYFCLSGRGYLLMENPEGDVQWGRARRRASGSSASNATAAPVFVDNPRWTAG
jgi:hypothetical protein